MKNRIDFLIAGNQKCGTTALHDLLAQHPALRMSAEKEMHYFDSPEFEESEHSHDDYHRRGWGVGVQGMDDGLLYGESTPKYVGVRPAGGPRYLPKIHGYNPDIKLIVLFRDPVERAYSQWNMLRQAGRSVPGFEELVARSLCGSTERSPYSDVVARGRYGQIVFGLLSIFPPENCCFLKVDDLNRQTGPVEAFLGIDRFDYEPRYSYSLPYESAISPAVAGRLRDHYRAEMYIFGKLTGIDVDHWVG